MADYVVDSTTGNNGDSGATFDLAWATLQYAKQSGGLVAGDFAWVRPNHSEIPTSDIVPVYSGDADDFINVIAWPKPAFSITSATWTNGSTTVDLVLPATLTRTGHIGRMITAPDGNDYFITYITDSNTLILLTEYAGSTVTGVSGASTIKADPYYTEAQALDDSTWTIKKTDWDANNPARGVVDFNDTGYQVLYQYVKNWRLQGLEFKDSTDGGGILQFSYGAHSFLSGILVTQTANNSCLLNFSGNNSIIDQCIIEGSGAGGNQVGINSARYSLGDGVLTVKNSAIYGCGDHGIVNSRVLFVDNLNVGVETANGDDDIYNSALVIGKDLKTGGTNGAILNQSSYGAHSVSIENYQRILGTHRTLWPGGYYDLVAVSGETPNEKLSANVMKITPDITGFDYIPEMAFCVFEDEWNNVPAGTYDIGYWIYNDSGVTLNAGDPLLNIWLEVEFLAGYDDTSEYVMTKKYSTLQDIADAADADDWDKLIASSCVVAATSKIRAKIFFSKYLAATNVFIDTEETEN